MSSDVGISTLLPEEAILCLVHAQQRAAGLPVDSIARQRVMRDAIRKVRLEYPGFFRDDDLSSSEDGDCGCCGERRREADW
mgnify:CR=1 FL=1